MIYDKIHFPLFVVHTDEIHLVDGILWIENQVLDDTNMKGKTLGVRRLQSPMKSIYPLKYMLGDIPSYLQHQGKYYIDSLGYFFTKHKKYKSPLKYYKILRVDKHDTISTLWIKDCPYPFTLKRPLPKSHTWVGILHRDDAPWEIYNVSENKEKDSWRKV